jgi:putative transcriptional regulator
VDTRRVLALLRANTMPEGPVHVYGKVYLVAARSLLEKTLAGAAGAKDLRVYLGYTGWGSGQLEGEVTRGLWHVFRADVDAAFDPEPDSLWSRLIAREEQKIARAQAPALFSAEPVVRLSSTPILFLQ